MTGNTANTLDHESGAGDIETRAGSYFIANYPMFTEWSPDDNPALEAAVNKPPVPGTPLGLYLHIPFCRKRCHFCYFKVYTGANAEVIRGYIAAVLRELEIYADRPFIGGRDVDFVYFGGGTPSFLSTEQIETLTTGLKRILPWNRAREITFECEPGTLNESRLQAIRKMGVTRLSLGVENFSDEILDVNGRAHRSDAVYAVYDFARRVEFPQINIDLIAGMINETSENWKDCVAKTIALAPDSVTIYQMEIPFNTTIFKRMKSEGRLSAPVADWPTKREWVAYAFEELERNGYDIVSGYTAVRKDRDVSFVYRDELWRGADLLSLGVASFGHISGIHYQNQQDIAPYMAAVQSGEFPVFRSCCTTVEQRMIREFILQCKLGRVSATYFSRKFGINIHEKFATSFERMNTLGVLAESSDDLVFTRDGLLQVDWLLHEIVIPELDRAK